ncbi:hypothetical protein GOP47_0020416 [Adiantum capillus-veneris]|uniref:Uncharacterized protein n=1 Tax=Adiantum capillus-veneris TaxID=13818 RepID=A0A9D4UD09_ADICA|nr:hypothetical protein GOP47_0020416 [Adiantum capillus-veneris]
MQSCSAVSPALYRCPAAPPSRTEPATNHPPQVAALPSLALAASTHSATPWPSLLDHKPPGLSKNSATPPGLHALPATSGVANSSTSGLFTTFCCAALWQLPPL